MQGMRTNAISNFDVEDYIIQPRSRKQKEPQMATTRETENYCTCRACSDIVFRDGFCFWHYQYEHYTSR